MAKTENQARKLNMSPKFKRRLLGYRRRDVDARVARMQAELARRTEDLEFEVGRLTEELSVATTADEDLALRATRRAVEAILTDAKGRAAAMTVEPDPVIDLREPAPAARDSEPVAS